MKEHGQAGYAERQPLKSTRHLTRMQRRIRREKNRDGYDDCSDKGC